MINMVNIGNFTFDEFKASYIDQFNKNNLSEYITDEYINKFYKLTIGLIEFNNHTNITAIVDYKEIILKHYIDSITIAKYLPISGNIADIGCGAGFPSLPIAIVRPDVNILCVDSTAKKLQFTKSISKELELVNITIFSERAEILGNNKNYREKFDAIISRAVANLQVLSELCMPLTKISGIFIAMKGKSGKDELNLSINALKKLGCDNINDNIRDINFDLLCNNESDERHIIIVKKDKATPCQYPRDYSQIKKKPL